MDSNENLFIHLDNTPFDARTNQFQLSNALFLAKTSALAYQDKVFIEYVTQELWQFPGFQFLEYKGEGLDTQAYIMANDEAIIITFRGTETKLEDWLTNIDIAFHPSDFGGHIHKGFWDALAPLQGDLISTIDFFNTNQQNIWLCGHSQGGALAMIAAALLHKLSYQIGGVYTYGQPRAGDNDFALHFNANLKNNTFRIVNHNDTVVHVPFESKGFSHAGTFVYLNEENMLEYDLAIWDYAKESIAHLLDTMLSVAIEGFPEHSLDTYIRKLSSLYDLQGF